jgi:hypothetical protein
MLAGLLGGCFFDADYGDGAGITCTDGRCPSGLTCRADQTCGPPIDAPPVDAADDAALTCADPGELPAAGGTVMGTTSGRDMGVSSMCGGFVMNGRDAVYGLMLPAGRTVTVEITGARKAYVIAPCAPAPATPACLGNMFATSASPLVVNPAAGASYVVVDDENPANAGTYTLGVEVN